MRIKSKHALRFLLTALLLLALVLPLPAQKRGGDIEEDRQMSAGSVTSGTPRKQWAVFIAIDRYTDHEKDLREPVKDAREIQQILRERYIVDYERELFNEAASAKGIHTLFANLQKEVGENDSVFVFHAGHGDNVNNAGYWIAADADFDPSRKAGWISHEEIRRYLNKLPARHVFLVSDSCFSGDLAVGLQRSGGAYPNFNALYYKSAYASPSRLVMTRGGSETVDDVSEFAARFKNTLKREEGLCIDPYEIHMRVRNLNPTPILGPMPESEHEPGGSFLFFKKGAEGFLAGLSTKPFARKQDTGGQAATGGTTLPPGGQASANLFIGTWTSTIEYKGSFDTYTISFLAGGRCTVRLENDTASQETQGSWSYDGKFLKLNAVFRNAKIAYQRNIQWGMHVRFSGGDSFSAGPFRVVADELVSMKFYRE